MISRLRTAAAIRGFAFRAALTKPPRGMFACIHITSAAVAPIHCAMLRCAVLLGTQLPAGVIEKGETVEQLAVRELKEETGYVGKVTRVTTEAANDQGLTNSCLNVSVFPGLQQL